MIGRSDDDSVRKKRDHGITKKETDTVKKKPETKQEGYKRQPQNSLLKNFTSLDLTPYKSPPQSL